ncbi:MAG TPA: hypothetical protein VGV67_00960, partial [Solirubrobacteraceae bacterium]|nr:hypothetical protein [Solirubrobacteraceae bacterium]
RFNRRMAQQLWLLRHGEAEPHALLPFAHWLPTSIRRRYWRLGVAGEWEEIALLRRAEMTELFGAPVAERAGPLVKSWISVRSL